MFDRRLFFECIKSYVLVGRVVHGERDVNIRELRRWKWRNETEPVSGRDEAAVGVWAVTAGASGATSLTINSTVSYHI